MRGNIFNYQLYNYRIVDTKLYINVIESFSCVVLKDREVNFAYNIFVIHDLKISNCCCLFRAYASEEDAGIYVPLNNIQRGLGGTNQASNSYISS